MLLQLLDAGIGRLHAARTFEAERLGDDADGEDALVTRELGDDRRRARDRAATHAGGDEAHVRAFERLFDIFHRLFGGGAADFRARTGAKTLGDLEAQLDAAFGRRGIERLRVGVRDDEVDALNVRNDHVGDRVAAGTADADHADPGLQFVNLRPHELDGHNSVSPAAALARSRRKLTANHLK